MSASPSYHDYVNDGEFMQAYQVYQDKYSKSIRESDRVLIGLIQSILRLSQREVQNLTLLDIGCSTGNLLLHLKHFVPDLKLIGGDLVESILSQCRARPELAGIAWEHLDVLYLPASQYDIVVANAVLCILKQTEWEEALRSISASLKPGGVVVTFDWAHPFQQELEIREVSTSHPRGMTLNFRSYANVKRCFNAAGLTDLEFHPFEIPIDLPRSPDDGDLTTYTIKSEDGRRLQMRGSIAQPWCHIVARKATPGMLPEVDPSSTGASAPG